MATNWSKFNQQVDAVELEKEIEEAVENGGGDFKDVPEGTYDVEIAKLELKESKNGDPMFVCWFRILAGEFKNSLLFYNQVIPFENKGFIGRSIKLLRALDSGLEIKFTGNYDHYEQLLMDVHEAIDGKLEYGLKYSKDKKGFGVFEITDVYDAEG